jgi:CMP-N-acetylneuraminic acid synthetase
MSAPKLSILIPARSGSKRIPNKNLQKIGSQTLLEIAVGIGKGVPGGVNVYVSTDSEEVRQIGVAAGGLAPTLRPAELAQDTSLDIDWVMHAIDDWGLQSEYFCILRPTSPFLQSRSLQVALETLQSQGAADSVRAIRRVTEHPGKMWRLVGNRILPLLPQIVTSTPSHSRPTQSLEEMYVQSGAFEMIRASTLIRERSISGNYVIGQILEQPESIDINNQSDLDLARSIYGLGLR